MNRLKRLKKCIDFIVIYGTLILPSNGVEPNVSRRLDYIQTNTEKSNNTSLEKPEKRVNITVKNNKSLLIKRVQKIRGGNSSPNNYQIVPIIPNSRGYRKNIYNKPVPNRRPIVNRNHYPRIPIPTRLNSSPNNPGGNGNNDPINYNNKKKLKDIKRKQQMEYDQFYRKRRDRKKKKDQCLIEDEFKNNQKNQQKNQRKMFAALPDLDENSDYIYNIEANINKALISDILADSENSQELFRSLHIMSRNEVLPRHRKGKLEGFKTLFELGFNKTRIITRKPAGKNQKLEIVAIGLRRDLDVLILSLKNKYK